MYCTIQYTCKDKSAPAVYQVTAVADETITLRLCYPLQMVTVLECVRVCVCVSLEGGGVLLVNSVPSDRYVVILSHRCSVQ